MDKTAIYTRFSSSKQREASIEDQLRICRDWCDRECYEVVAFWNSVDLTGNQTCWIIVSTGITFWSSVDLTGNQAD